MPTFKITSAFSKAGEEPVIRDGGELVGLIVGPSPLVTLTPGLTDLELSGYDLERLKKYAKTKINPDYYVKVHVG